MPEASATPEGEDRPEPSEEDLEQRDTALEERVKRHVALLSEHCDSVRIIVTANRGDGNWSMFSWGNGNFYAQRDSAREWLMRQDQGTKNDVENG